MKCSYCGAELREGSLYCASCGKEAQINPDFNAFEDEYLKAILEEENQLFKNKETDGGQKKQIKSQKEKEKKKKIILLSAIAASCVLIVVIAVVVRVSISRQRDNSYDYQIAQGKSEQASGNLVQAVQYYEKALSLNPDDVTVRLLLGEIFMEQKEYDSALLLYDEVRKLAPQNVEAYRKLIAIYEAQGSTEEIQKLYQSIENEKIDSKIRKLFADYIVLPPEFSEESGTFEDYMEITISAENGCRILYTMDGKDPKRYGDEYTEAIALDEMQEYEINAVCVNEKGVYSDVVTGTYRIEIPAPEMPTVTPDGGDFGAETKVTIAVPDGCSAYYTWDGSTPNIHSERYTEPITVPEGNNVLAVILIDDKTEQESPIYRGNFIYYAN